MCETRILGIGSVPRAPIAFIIALALWLSSATGDGRATHGDFTVEHASPITLALPGIPGPRLGRPPTSAARDLVARDGSHGVTALPAGFVEILPASSRLAIPAGSGRISRNSLALTFPYDATAPPAFLRT